MLVKQTEVARQDGLILALSGYTEDEANIFHIQVDEKRQRTSNYNTRLEVVI